MTRGVASIHEAVLRQDQLAVTRYTRFAELPEFLSPREVAAWLRVGRNQGYEIANQLGTRVGRLIRVHREVLRQFTEGKL